MSDKDSFVVKHEKKKRLERSAMSEYNLLLGKIEKKL